MRHPSRNPSPMPSLQISGLSLAWDDGTAPLFSHWQATLAPGLHWLQGDAGSGKTTLLRWLAGQALPGARLQGRVLVDGVPLAAPAAWLDASDPSFDNLTPAALRDHLRQRHPALDNAAWQRHIDGFSLAPHGFKTLHMLSSGMRRKAALAAVLAAGAPLTLLDEPTAGLDGPATAWLVQALTALAAPPGRWVLAAAGAWPAGLARTSDLLLG